ncbi:MAG: ATP-binding protein [Hyphomicrobiaceae bacterium]|nr:ATP-binding protein [Hyphomicrobiaceae bacterium]
MTSDIIRPRRSYQTWVANETMEDYSLRYAAKSFRKFKSYVIVNTALGGISFLALEAIGGAITLSYGFSNAIPAILVVCALVFITNLPISYYSSRYNIDMDLLTRGAGFGYIGSTITSVIYACFTFIFFALEAAIMAQALELYFSLPIVIGYIVSSIVIIPITFLGITLISRLQLITQPIWAVMLIAPYLFIFYKDPEVLSSWVSFVGRREGADGFNYLYFGAATGVLFSLVVQIGEQVDYLRFMPDLTKQNRLKWWTAVISAGPGWIIIGGLKILAGSLLTVIAINSGLGLADAVEPIHMYIKAYEFVSTDPVIVLTAAMIFVLISQIKINVTNAYAGSLAWSNFYSRITHYHPGRVVWLVFNILISLLLMLLGVFETLETVLAVYSNIAIAWIGAIFADLTVLKPLRVSPSYIEFKRAHLYNVNPVGCGAMAIASLLSLTAFSGLLGPVAEAYSAALSLGTAFVAAIAIGFATKGKYYIAREDAFSDSENDETLVRCVICNYAYETPDMAYCPFYEGPICSLCCSLDAHCHDVCKRPAEVQVARERWRGHGYFQRLIPPNMPQRLAKFLGVFVALAVVTAAVFLVAYRMMELDDGIGHIDNARLLTRVYLASLVLICIGAWWIVLSHESRELAEHDLVTSLETLTETRQELMQSERLATIGQLTATVSHELRNPLGTLVSSVSVLKKYLGKAEPEVRDELERMQRNTWRCVRIIEDLLEFSRDRNLQIRPVEIDRWVSLQLDEQEIPDGVNLRTDLRSNATVMMDSEKFRQAFVNLVQNAHQAIAQRDTDKPPQGELNVRTRANGKMAEVTISDDGCGIRPEDSSKIFGPLYSTKAFGVGLGLPLVKQIVDGHHGSMEVKSKWGEGTTITVRLPVSGTGGVQGASSRDAGESGRDGGS